MSDDEHFYDGLEDVDRKIRIDKLRREIEEAGGIPFDADDQDLPPMIEEAFLENVLFFEKSPRTSYAKMLIEDGIELPPVDSLTPEALEEKLWEVIRGLAGRQVYLYHTDHLSDNALYHLLWGDLLNHDTVDISISPDTACHLDLVGSGAEEDIAAYLRYYADDEDRRHWANEFGPDEIPDREKPPFDRDRFLPKRPTR